MSPRLFPLILCAFASQAQLVVLPTVITAAATDFEVSVGVVGQARSVTAVMAILVSLALARPSTAIWSVNPAAPRVLAVTGALSGVLGSAAVGFAPGLAGFGVAHVLVGVSLAALLCAAFAGVAACPRDQRLRAVGLVAAGNALAWIVVAPAAGAVTEALSWRAAQSVPAICALGALFGARWISARPPSRQTSQATGSGVLTEPSTRRWLLGESIAYAAWAALLTFAGAYFVHRFRLGDSMAGVVLAAGAGCYALAATQLGRLGGRFGSRQLVLGSTGMLAVLAPMLLLGQPSLPLAAMAFCLIGLCAGVRTPSSATMATEQAEGREELMMTARTAVTQIGYLGGAALGGPVVAAFGFGALGLLLGAGFVASAHILTARPASRPAGSGPGDGRGGGRAAGAAT